jgi:hypothetical protein
MKTPLVDYPRLVTNVTLHDGSTFAVNKTEREAIERTLRRLDGSRSIAEIVQAEPSLSWRQVEDLITSLDQAGLVDDDVSVTFRPGAEVILEVEELIEQHCAATIYQNPFWKACLDARQPGDLPEKLAIGMIIENWHFLYRESYFDAPVLSYIPNTAVRLLLNQFFSEEYGHDDILLKALNFAGLTRDDMLDAIPLPETMGLCNSLAHWAYTDPLFFFVTLGLLEGQEKNYDSFIEACDRTGLPDGLVKPLKTHADINIGAAHGSLTRLIFQEIRAIDEVTVERLKRQAYLFVQLYDNFYTGVWQYYISDAPLLRRVRDL